MSFLLKILAALIPLIIGLLEMKKPNKTKAIFLTIASLVAIGITINEYRLGKEQEKNTIFLSQLDNQIRDIRLRITFLEPVEFEKICPMNLVLSFSGNDRLNRLQQIEFHIKDDMMYIQSASSKYRGEAYKIRQLAIPGEKTPTEYIFGSGLKSVAKLEIPLFRFLEDSPFKTIREIDDLHFTPRIPRHILDLTDSIEIIINGWIIVNGKKSTAFWKSEKVVSTLIKEPITLYSPWSSDFHGKRPPHGLWHIYIQENLPRYDGEL